MIPFGRACGSALELLQKLINDHSHRRGEKLQIINDEFAERRRQCCSPPLLLDLLLNLLLLLRSLLRSRGNLEAQRLFGHFMFLSNSKYLLQIYRL